MNGFRSILLIIFILPLMAASQSKTQYTTAGTPLMLFEQNQNQWPEQVLYKADFASGRVFLEKDAFTFVVYSAEDLFHTHGEELQVVDSIDPAVLENQRDIHMHAFRLRFLGSNVSPQISGLNKKEFHYNYFLGNDPDQWASDVEIFEASTYHDFYPGIDMKVSSEGPHLKYEFIVAPGADPSQINYIYEGIDSVWITEEILFLKTSVGEIREMQPYTYQQIGESIQQVDCRFKLSEGVVSFDLSQYYDASLPLVIDPTLIAATYSGSNATTYGHSATYGPNGHIFSGGRCFGTGYPVTLGAFQTAFGGSVDIAVSKLSPTGTNLLWATFIGGGSDDYVHSMIVDPLDRIYIYGSSSSTNYPTTAGCYDNSANGSYDIIVSKLNANGSALIGSTYVGGSQSDAQNIIPKNYGDTYRGEIVLDSDNNIYIASFSMSANFPVTAGVLDNSHNGLQDAVIFKLDSNLTQLIWSTFLGGSGNDAAYALKLDTYNNVMVGGGTTSTNFPVSISAQTPVFQGNTDGFVSYIYGNGAVLINSSYFGTSQFDQIYFLELDSNINVYVYGTSDGLIPVTPPTTYNNSFGNLFVAKFNQYLTSTLFSTRLGATSSTTQFAFSPTAFLVDVCENIYLAGWGATNSYPVSSTPLMATTDGSDFYLMVLDKNAAGLMYGTYFGDNTGTWDHVDGGTSRFDKNGVVYHGVCAGGSGIPATPGAYAPIKFASWDIAVFKIDFQMIAPIALASISPNDTLCAGDVFSFVNNSSNYVSAIWDFGDGSPLSTVTSPNHQYALPGTYQVTLIAIDSTKCIVSDTVYMSVTSMPIPSVILGADTSLCMGDSVILDAGSGHLTQFWSTGDTTQTLLVHNSDTIWVLVSNGPCYDSDTINITFNIPPLVILGNDTSVCEGVSLILDAGNPGSDFTWSTGVITQTLQVDTGGLYWVQVADSISCHGIDSITITIKPLPLPDLGPDTLLCEGEIFPLDAGSPGAIFLWSTGASTQQIQVSMAGSYSVSVNLDGCLGADSILIDYIPGFSLGPDKNLCDFGEITLDAGMGDAYLWSDDSYTQSIPVTIAGLYWVIKEVAHCVFTDSVNITGVLSPTLYFPNSFTPNGDGLNDRFEGKGAGLMNFSIEVYTRLGQLVFRSEDLSLGWDGMIHLGLASEGVYVWVATMTTLCEPDRPVRLQGTVHLMR